MKVGLRGQAEAGVGVKTPEYFWRTALYITFLSLQQIIIRVCVFMCQQTRVKGGFAAQRTDMLSNCSLFLIFLLIYFQQDATLHSLFISRKLLYVFRVVSPPIIRSTHNCIYSIWYLSNRYCCMPLLWKS